MGHTGWLWCYVNYQPLSIFICVTDGVTTADPPVPVNVPHPSRTLPLAEHAVRGRDPGKNCGNWQVPAGLCSRFAFGDTD